MKDHQTLLLATLAGIVLVIVIVALVLLVRELGSRSLEHRVDAVIRAGGQTAPAVEKIGGWGRPLAWIGEIVRARTRMYSDQDIQTLEAMISSSGFKPRGVLPILLGAKVVMLVAIPGAIFLYAEAAGFTTSHLIMAVCLALPIGLLAPDWIITFLRRPYLAALRRGVPDALDLLVVCSEAGMGLESALSHVSHEITYSNPAMALALGRLIDDMRVLPDRREAFNNFADRTGVDGAKRVATMMAQAMKYGTPISQALRTIAIDLRRDRMLTLEAKAIRLPVLLTVPLILFVMPTLMIVLAGPSMIQIVNSLRSMAKM